MRCKNFRRYYPMSENYDHIEEMQRAEEATGGGYEGKDATNVRRAVKKVMNELGIKNTIDDVRKDNYFWQINFSSSLNAEQRKTIQEKTAKALGIKPELIKLVSLYSAQK